MKIELNVEEDLKGLAGESLGKAMFNTQVKPFLKEVEQLEIIFPKSVEKVSISFVQGFSEGFNKGEQFIISANEQVTEKFNSILTNELNYVKLEDEDDYVSVDLELEHDVIVAISLLAHEKNITLNQMLNDILREQIVVFESLNEKEKDLFLESLR